MSEFSDGDRERELVEAALTEAERETLYRDELVFDNLHSAWARDDLERTICRIVAARASAAVELARIAELDYLLAEVIPHITGTRETLRTILERRRNELAAT